MASRRKKNVLDLSRRGFLASTAAAAAASLRGCVSPQTRPGEGPSEKDVVTKKPQVSYSTGPVLKLPDRIRVGLIGCGGRGTGAAIDCANAEPNVEFVALGDLFQDRLDGSRKTLNEKVGARCKVTDGNCFTGFDAYKGVLNAPIDLVILATPPGFRPIHLKAAVEAKKHVFMEKPVAVDPIGARSVIDSAELASQQGLGIVAGTQRRHEASYIETMKRIHDGAIGKIVAAQCYWNQEGLWVNKKQPNWSDMEWQCRNWLYFSWLSGDHIVEQHVHNIDVINWALQATPVKCVGMGGRQWRTGPEYGNIWDHFAVEYEYPGGVRVLSMCRQTEKTSTRVSEHLVGEKGMANPNGSIEGRKAWKYEAPEKPVNPYVQEHADLIASIRAGKPLNEGVRIAESTLTAIMGRMSGYTGR
ncbi:MAG: Gfo/Idh/MocA family oxidoreductase, partial [Planctomycetes bacterium]|nr:Gfo/Idh/MocA family oxidoreductase [Planctomycetota bacterium]